MGEEIERATAEHQTTENWELILHICDAIKGDENYMNPAETSIKKRLNHRDPHVVILALSVLDSCWANSGVTFRRKISRDFINELESKCKSSVRQVGEKSRLMIKKWVDNEVKEDVCLSRVRTLYKTLAADGLSFESSEAFTPLIYSSAAAAGNPLYNPNPPPRLVEHQPAAPKLPTITFKSTKNLLLQRTGPPKTHEQLLADLQLQLEKNALELYRRFVPRVAIKLGEKIADQSPLIVQICKTLATDGLSFESSEPKKRVLISNDPNVVTSQEEEGAIAKAIAAPLSDTPRENGSESQDDAVRKLMATITAYENAKVIAAEARRAATNLEEEVRRAKKELEVMKKAQRLAQLKASLPHEPADGAPGTLLLSLFIPGKGQVMRRFSRSMPLSVFFTFLESEGMEPDQLGLSPGDGMDEWDPSTTLGEIGNKSTR